jgi:hypothetical protein
MENSLIARFNPLLRDKMQRLRQRTPDQVSAAAVLMALGGASGEQ